MHDVHTYGHFLYGWYKSGGTVIGIGLILFGDNLGVFSFNAPISLPNIVSAFTISSIVNGQFGRRFCYISFLKSEVLGLPIVIYSFLANKARVYSLFVESFYCKCVEKE